MRKEKTKIVLVSSIIIALTFILFSFNVVISQADTLSDIEEKLTDITDGERETLEKLFTMAEELEVLGLEQQEIAHEIEIVNIDIVKIEKQIKSEKSNFDQNKNTLKQVLKSYQRRGAGSYLEVLLKSDNLTEFIRRLNTLRDITRNTGQLLEKLEKSEKNLFLKKESLGKKLLLVKGKQESLEDSVSKTLKLKEEYEVYLLSLKEDKEYYQEYLNKIQLLWNETKPLMVELTNEFSTIIEKEELPPNVLEITTAFPNIIGNLDEETFNEIFKDRPMLYGMTLSFNLDEVQIEIPDKDLVLTGTFIIVNDSTLEFQVSTGSFHGISLNQLVIEELFRENPLTLNLKPLIGKSIIQSIKILKGHLELRIKLVLL